MVRKIESKLHWLPTLIIIVTGNVDLKEYNECMDSKGLIRADMFFRKPLTSKDFEEIVSNVNKTIACRSYLLLVERDE